MEIKIKKIIDESIRYKEDLKKVRKFLKVKGIKIKSLLEIETLWLMYSGSMCASFLIVSEYSLNEFMKWIEYY